MPHGMVEPPYGMDFLAASLYDSCQECAPIMCLGAECCLSDPCDCSTVVRQHLWRKSERSASLQPVCIISFVYSFINSV